jgi:hypothetical protein
MPNSGFLRKRLSHVGTTPESGHSAWAAQTELAHVNRFSTAGEPAASIAHEINEPLGAILTNAETADAILKSQSPDIAAFPVIVAVTCPLGQWPLGQLFNKGSYRSLAGPIETLGQVSR